MQYSSRRVPDPPPPLNVLSKIVVIPAHSTAAECIVKMAKPIQLAEVARGSRFIVDITKSPGRKKAEKT
jgi:hypothetical protein